MANDYIRREDAKDALQEKVFHNLTDEFYGAMQVLDELEPADVVHVRHGTWIDMGWHGDWQWETDGRGNCWHLWKCNRCDGKVKIKTDFCPNCGAKMDAQGEE